MAANIHFIFQDVPLNFCPSHVSDILYLEAKAKNLRQKQLQQAKRLQQMLALIQNQQKAQKSKINYQSKVIIGPRKIPDFYQYNQQWQNKIEKKNDQARKEKRLKQNYQEQSLREIKPKDHSVSITQYCGPITGWNHHFQNYIKVRTEGCEVDKELFKPKVNKNSQKIIQKKYAGKSKQKVEERLIRQSNDKKLHNYSTIKNQSQVSISARANPQIFNKLYNDASKQARRKQQIRQQSQFSFQPKINKNTIYQSSVSQKRKPLHQPTQLSIQTQIGEQKKQQRQFSEDLFNNFIERNQILLSKRKNTQFQMKKQSDQQIMKQCTFAPTLNQRSMSLVNNLKHSSSIKSKIHDISSDSLQNNINNKVKSHVIVPLIPPIPRHNYDTDVLKTQQSTRRKQFNPVQNSSKKKQQLTKSQKLKMIIDEDQHQNYQLPQQFIQHPQIQQVVKHSAEVLQQIQQNIYSIEYRSKVQISRVILNENKNQSNKKEIQRVSIKNIQDIQNMKPQQFLDEFQLIQRQLEEMINSAK